MGRDTKRIKVVGIGGAGNNAVNAMIKSGLKSVEFIVVDADKQALKASNAKTKIYIGKKLTRGPDANADPETGRIAAEKYRDHISRAIRAADMVFIIAGMGGGTGTGAAPVIASIAKELGIHTVAVVVKPFTFEGSKRMTQAETGIKALMDNCNEVTVISNDNLLGFVDENTTIKDAFGIADDLIRQHIQRSYESLSHKRTFKR